MLVLLATLFRIGRRFTYKWITAAAKGEVETYAAVSRVGKKVSADSCLRIPIDAKNFMIRPDNTDVSHTASK